MFELPLEEKLKFEVSDSNGFRGYENFEAENLEPQNKKRGDTKEGFYSGTHYDKDSWEAKNIPLHCPNVFPK